MEKIPLSFPIAYNGLISKRSGRKTQKVVFNLLILDCPPDHYNAFTSSRITRFKSGTEFVTVFATESFLNKPEGEIVERIRKLKINRIETVAKSFHRYLVERIDIDDGTKRDLDRLISEDNYDVYIARVIRLSLNCNEAESTKLNKDQISELENLSKTTSPLLTVSSPPEGSFQMNPEEVRQFPFNREYYNLFVIADESFESDHFLVPGNEALTKYIDRGIGAEFSLREPEAVEKIKEFPSLFMQAREEYEEPLDHEVLYCGIVTDVKTQRNGIAISWRRIGSVPLTKMIRLFPSLNIFWKPTTSELNHGHWTIKESDLISEMRNAGITFWE